MIGTHCVKAWSKTQSVVAKSLAESELYSVVKGATEGLGLVTLYANLGCKKEVQLNLDAAAAKGIEAEVLRKESLVAMIYWKIGSSRRRVNI